MTQTDPPRSPNLPPGYDEEDPYEDEDVSTYPQWWQQNIELFERYGLRPYRPPQFLDGVNAQVVIDQLEQECGVEIRLQIKNPTLNQDWQLLVDGEEIAMIGRRRDGEGFSRYEIHSGEFETLIKAAIE